MCRVCWVRQNDIFHNAAFNPCPAMDIYGVKDGLDQIKISLNFDKIVFSRSNNLILDLYFFHKW